MLVANKTGAFRPPFTFRCPGHVLLSRDGSGSFLIKFLVDEAVNNAGCWIEMP